MKLRFQASPQDIIFVFILTVVSIVSISHLTTVPRIFYDEGITIEIARNFQLFHVLDLQTKPGEFSGIPYVTGSSGFPVTLPLSLFFSIFGFGFPQARWYALLWLLALLVMTYVFISKKWNKNYALASVLLLATFASFYDSGRRVLGDIPGFVLLVGGLYAWNISRKYFLAGFLFGLATVAKPSVYIPILPALLIAYLIYNRRLWKEYIKITLGAAIPFLVWIALAFPQPFSSATWQKVLIFYRNPYGSAHSSWASIIHNVPQFLTHSTLLYFSVMGMGLMVSWFLLHRPLKKNILLLFSIIYSVFILYYFLNSPFRIRYFLPVQFLMFLYLPIAIDIVLKKLPRLHKNRFFYSSITGLAILQLVQLLYFSNVIYGTSEPEAIERFFQEHPAGMIGLVNSPNIAFLIPPERKLSYLFQNDLVVIGEHPLDKPAPQLPTYVILPAGYDEHQGLTSKQGQQLTHYKIIHDGKWQIWELKS
ncbi:MAG: glycosyltransferase family 39 protein [Candidatus Yanofskybacteria bacterium]|nr:glycosyltransferase family 39 protein [Candidatus Yanofskybacteria bacterium]